MSDGMGRRWKAMSATEPTFSPTQLPLCTDPPPKRRWYQRADSPLLAPGAGPLGPRLRLGGAFGPRLPVDAVAGDDVLVRIGAQPRTRRHLHPAAVDSDTGGEQGSVQLDVHTL